MPFGMNVIPEIAPSTGAFFKVCFICVYFSLNPFSYFGISIFKRGYPGFGLSFSSFGLKVGYKGISARLRSIHQYT